MPRSSVEWPSARLDFSALSDLHLRICVTITIEMFSSFLPIHRDSARHTVLAPSPPSSQMQPWICGALYFTRFICHF